MRVATLLPLLLAVVAAPLHAQQIPDDVASRIDRVFARFDRTDGPGCAVGVVRSGSLVHARGFGIGNLDHGIPITPRSVFYLASVAKQFTAAAVLIAAPIAGHNITVGAAPRNHGGQRFDRTRTVRGAIQGHSRDAVARCPNDTWRRPT